VPYQRIPPVTNYEYGGGEYSDCCFFVHFSCTIALCDAILWEIMQLLFLVVLVFAIIVHEVAHGYVALLLGDPTAEQEGRLTLNPIPHIDILGTLIIPGILLLSGSGILFGWAKPVPYNPYNLKGRYGEAMVAAAGPGINIAFAVVFGLLFRFGGTVLPESLLYLCLAVVPVNLFLAFFNLIPIPPLDGSKILMTFLPTHLRLRFEQWLASFTGRQNIIALLLLLLFLSWFALDYVVMLVVFLTEHLTGSAIF